MRVTATIQSSWPASRACDFWGKFEAGGLFGGNADFELNDHGLGIFWDTRGEKAPVDISWKDQ